MGIVFKLVLLILMLCPLTINSSFQYLTFVQQWPRGYCTVNPANPSRCQRIPLPTVFTIHGLWPGNFTKILQNCTKTSYTQLQNFQDWNNRNLRWPDLAKPLPTMQNFQEPRFQSFWKHEWKKHGTCSENMYPEATYFSRTIQLSQRHNILNYLATGNIFPGSNPTVSSVNSTIYRAISNHVPDLMCVTPPRQTPALVEIGICFTATMTTIIDCPSQFLRTGSCGIGTINFPA
ncbi:unnamed protein product [Coffea canephora]|uniref:Uncharacterized protein n=1 Tax=Coffea canephora TaxID=49390 RepID=A0A068V811_COFCA|nr:unnamed protein product [Coffea canephora]